MSHQIIFLITIMLICTGCYTSSEEASNSCIFSTDELNGTYLMVSPYHPSSGSLSINGGNFHLRYSNDVEPDVNYQGYVFLGLDGRLILKGEYESNTATIFLVDDYFVLRLGPGLPIIAPSNDKLLMKAIGPAFISEENINRYKSAKYTESKLNEVDALLGKSNSISPIDLDQNK